MSASMKARIAEHVAAPTPPLPAAGIWIRAASPPLLLPSTSHRTDIPKAEMPPRKRVWTTLEADLRRDRVMDMGYRIIDTWDEIVEAMLEVAPTTLEGVNQRVTELATTVRQENEESQTSSEDKSAAIEAHVRTLETHVATLIAQTTSLQTQLTTTLGRIETQEARDLEPQDEPAEAGSSY
ncbi:hypothetical protein Tco_0799178 [Tanacetum coccineum]